LKEGRVVQFFAKLPKLNLWLRIAQLLLGVIRSERGMLLVLKLIST
jgi:hypothetical protein